jgi:hypothetical protein
MILNLAQSDDIVICVLNSDWRDKYIFLQLWFFFINLDTLTVYVAKICFDFQL